MGGLGFCQGILAAPVLLALLLAAINFATRVEYKVHNPHDSAVIITGASTGQFFIFFRSFFSPLPLLFSSLFSLPSSLFSSLLSSLRFSCLTSVAGIGRHAAEELARYGFYVYASVRSDKDEAELLKAGVPSLIPFRLDVSNPESRVCCLRS